MKTILLTVALIATASVASATCKPSGKDWSCQIGNTTYNVANATSEAEAHAAAKAYAHQLQEQLSINDNSNAINFEGDPKHTTSMSLGVGLNFNVPIASGVQTRNAIDTANWFLQNGDRCTAFQIMSKAPRVRNLKINFTCGDKG